MTSILERRPFNVRYIVRQPSGPDPEKKRCTFGTAECNWAYIMRTNAKDEFGPTPDFASRDDLVANGRAGPMRALRQDWADNQFWRMLDGFSLDRRPDQATAVHMVGSLPIHDTPEQWRQTVISFVEDEISSKGMVVDWGIHFRVADRGRPAIHPHVHILASVRTFDRDPGRRNPAWFGSERAERQIKERWSELTRLYPAPAALAA